MERISQQIKTPVIRQVRLRCFEFLKCCLKTLNLRLRTQEMAYVLLDSALSRLNYNTPDAQGLCLLCLFFAIKLETDFSSELIPFIQMWHSKFKISLKDIFKNEHVMFDLMPESLGRMVFFSEIVEAALCLPELVEALGTDINCSSMQQKCFEVYVNGSSVQSVFDICFLPLILSLSSPAQRHTAFACVLKLFRQLGIPPKTARSFSPEEQF